VEEAADLLPLANKDLKSVSYLDLFLEGFKILCGPGNNIHLDFEIMAHLFELVTVSLLDVLDDGCDIVVLTVVRFILSSFLLYPPELLVLNLFITFRICSLSPHHCNQLLKLLLYSLYPSRLPRSALLFTRFN